MTAPIITITDYRKSTFDPLMNVFFPEGSWYSSNSIIGYYPEERDKYKDMYSIYGSEEFELQYGTDPIGCFYVTHDDDVHIHCHI